MDILKFPDPRLLIPCKEVSVFGDSLVGLLNSMYDTMKKENGIGLSANQVGLSFRMFVMEGPNGIRYNIVNPVILKQSKYPAMLNEGCLSAPGEFLTLPGRPGWVHISYQDESGMQRESVFRDIYSVCVCHEIDHLDGKTFLLADGIAKTLKNKLKNKWGLK